MITARRLPFDPLLAAMAAGLALAVGAMAYPAFRGNPWSAPGMILILTAGLIALVGLFGFRRAEAGRPASDVAVDLLDAMAEPAALVLASGQVLAFNAAWAEANGADVALPRGKSAQALYMAFAQARRRQTGRAILEIGERELEVVIGLAGEGRYLVRAAPDAALPDLRTGASEPRAQAALPGDARAMAAGAPFGSAVIGGEDLFVGRAEEPNAALKVLTGPAAAGDAAFGHLFEPAGVGEARAKLVAGSSGPIELVARAFPDRMLHLYVAPEGDKRRIWLFDVSAQKSMELQLSQAQKMQAVGQLAGGVALDEQNAAGARLLRQRGYEVIEAADGEEALILAEEHAGEIDMLISDVIMPGLDGPSLLKKARPYLGDAPVMFISGYAESDFSDLLQDEVGVSFLPKPLDIKTLAERVKKELHAG